MRKVTINEIGATVGLLAERSLKKYGNYAYSMGVASTILTELIDNLPAKKKAEILARISTLTPDPIIEA